MSIKINISSPSGDIGFVEYKRSFVVEGFFEGDQSLKDDIKLSIELYDANGNLVRFACCDKKYKEMFLNYPGLKTYAKNMDLDFKKLKTFGFPALVVNDIDNPYESIHNATIKAWYSDKEFKAIIISASNIESGAIFDDGMNFVDENANPYHTLEMGEYKIIVSLFDSDNVLSSTSKNITIGKNNNQLICRVNPINHKDRMLKFASENNFSMINELLPGYLNPYLGVWQYHMGLLKMFRANDICLFDDVDVVLFDYLIDETSISYSTELAFLQKNNMINKRLSVYYYDIGEAMLGINIGDKQCGIIKKFNNNEYGVFYRVDVVKQAIENVYYIDESNVISFQTDLCNVHIHCGDNIAISGVVKPIQLDPNDFILQDDNTYKIMNYPKYIKYTFKTNNKVYEDVRNINVERFDNISIGKSIYEFYNTFVIPNDWHNSIVLVSAQCIYEKGNITKINNNIRLYVI